MVEVVFEVEFVEGEGCEEGAPVGGGVGRVEQGEGEVRAGF